MALMLAAMSIDELRASIEKDTAPPRAANLAIQALWHDARGDWERAHSCAQDERGADGSWVHAYLHRKEGDFPNAGYWYTRAGRPTPAATLTLSDEWAEIARALLAGK